MDQTQPKTPNYSESRRNDFGRSYGWGFGQSRKDDKSDYDWLNNDKSKRNFSDLDSEEIGRSRGIAQSLGQTRKDNLDLGFDIYESRNADKYYDGSVKEDYESTKEDQSLRPYGKDYLGESQLARESTNGRTFLSQTENGGRKFSKSKREETSGAYLGKTFHDTRTRESSTERQHGYTQDWGKSRQENGVSHYRSEENVSARGIRQSSKQNAEHRNYGESRADDRSNGPLTLQNKFDNDLGQSRLQDGESGWERRSLQSLPERKDWRHMASSGTFRRDYFDVKDSYRPRISIRANIKDYGNSFKDDSLNTSSSSASSVRRWSCSRYVMITCIVLTCAAIAGAITLAVVLSTLSRDPPKDKTKYFEVSMSCTVREEFIEEYSNISSAEFRNFSSNFCNAVKEYSNNVTYSEGSQCIVDEISATISTTVVTNDLQSIFNTSSTSLNVGVIVFIQVTVIQVEVKESVVTNPFPPTQTTQAVITQSTTPIATTGTTSQSTSPIVTTGTTSQSTSPIATTEATSQSTSQIVITEVTTKSTLPTATTGTTSQSTSPVATTGTTSQSTSPIATTSTTTELTTFETTITENNTEEMNTTNMTTETSTITMDTSATFSSENDTNTTSTTNSNISNTTPSSTDTETSTASTVPTTISSTSPTNKATETSTASTVPTIISSTTPTNKATETSTASTVPTNISSTTPTNKVTETSTASTVPTIISSTTPTNKATETSTASTVPTNMSSTTPTNKATETSTASTVPTTISSTTPTNKETETSTASTVPTTISSTTPTNKATETSTASTVPTNISSTSPTNKVTETSTASTVPITISSTTPTNKATETSTASTVPTTISSTTPTNKATETSTASTVPTIISSTTLTNNETETSTASTVPTTISSTTPTNKETETSTASTVPITISSTTPTNKETETSTASTVPTTISSITPTNKETHTSTVTTMPTTTSNTTPTNKETESSTASTVPTTISSPMISSTKTDTSTLSTMPTTIPSKSPTNQETESTATTSISTPSSPETKASTASTVPSTIPSSTPRSTETDTSTASTMPTISFSTTPTNKESDTSTASTVPTTNPSSTPRSTETDTSTASKMPTTISSTAPTNKETDRSTESTMPTTISSSTPSSSETDTSTTSTMPTTISSTTTSTSETDTSTASTMPTTISSTTPSSADTDTITASTVPTTVSSTTPSDTDTDASTASTVVTTIFSTTMTIDTDVHFESTNVAQGNQKVPSVETGGTLALTCNSASSQSITVKRLNGNGEEVIAVYDGSTVQISNNYTSRIVQSSGNRSMDLNISSISCRDEGLYVCESMIEGGTRVNASLTVQVYGKADLAVNADFVELFPRLNYDHVCSVTIVETGNAYVRIEDSTGASTSTTYNFKSNTGIYDTTKNFTRVSLPNGDEMFVISETEQSNGCETSQKIYFLLNITNSWNGGSISCGYEDVRQGRHINNTKSIQLIPRYYCDGFSHNFYRQHPEGCTKYVQCSLIDGDMYPFGFSCNPKCFNFQTELCATCGDEATCQEHTTPSPTTPVPTIDPSQVVISCNDSTVNLENSPVVLKPCSILKDNFTSINISKENSLGEIFNIGLLNKDGQNVIQSSDDFRGTITLSDTTELVFTNVTCADEAVYNMYVLNYGQHVWTTSFSLDVEVDITYGNLSIKSSYDEGEDLTITGVLYVNSAQDIEVSIKYPSSSEFTELQGNLMSANEKCLLKVTWTAQEALRLSASMSGAVVKVFDTRTMRILDQQAVMVTLQSVGFDEYARTVPLGEDATIRCAVRDISDWTVIEIIKEYNNTSTTILSQKKGDTLVTMSDRISGTLTTNGTTLYIDVVLQNVICSDEANYACVVNTSSSSVMTSPNNFVLSVTDLPGTPTIDIHANFVARIAFAGYLHKCSGTLGYPADTRHLGLRLSSINGSQFVYSERGIANTIESGYLKIIDIDTSLDEKMYVKNNIVVENGCHIEQTIEFLLQLHNRWNFGNITCFIEDSNDKVNETSTTKEIVLTPRDVCYNISNDEKIQHPDGCNKWIICSDGNPYGRACTDDTQCYDVYNSNDFCEPCSQVYCGPLTTTTPATTTTVNPDDIRAECNSSRVENGAMNVRTVCTLKADSFFRINISKTSEGTSGRQTIISFDENSEQYYGTDAYSVEKSFAGTPRTFSLVIPLINCSYQGTYTVEVFLDSNETSVMPEQFDINILDKPDEPILDISVDSSENSARIIHTCKGYVGNPRGTFRIEIKRNDSSNFQEYPDFLVSGEEAVTKVHCGEHVEYKFGLKMPSSFNLSTARCQAENEFSISSGDEILSNSEVITLIPDGYCDGISSGYKHHPLGCGYYVWCVNEQSNGVASGSNLCFDFSKNISDYCTQIPECSGAVDHQDQT